MGQGATTAQHRELSEAARKRGSVLVIAATFCFWLSLYFYVPFLPLRAVELGATNTVVGAVVAAYAIAQVSLRVPIGVAADVLGKRKPFAVAALFFSAAGALWLGLSPNPISLFFARAVTGIAGAGWVAISVLYSSYFAREQTAGAMARIMAVNSTGLVLATLTGGFLADALDTTSTFWASVTVGMIGGVLLLAAPEPAVGAGKSYSRETFMAIAKTPLLIAVSVMAIFLQFVNFSTQFGFVPVYAESIGATNSQVGYITTAMFASGVAGTLLGRQLVKRTGYTAALVIGSVLLAVSSLTPPMTESVMTLGATQVLAGLARGGLMSMQITLSVLAVAPEQRATAMGLFQAIYAIGMLAGPVVSGVVADTLGVPAVFYVSTAVALAGGLIVFSRSMREARI